MLLLDTSTVTATGTSGASRLPRYACAAEVQLTVSAAATAAGDTLNVYIQGSVDNGTTYDDIISFTQVLGNGGAKKFLARWNGLQAPTTAMAAPQDAALAAGSIAQGPKGRLWRVKYVIASASAPSFTIRVIANVFEQR